MSCCASYPDLDARESSIEALDASNEQTWIAVEWDDDATFLDFDSLAAIDLDGRRVVPFTEVWAAAELAVDAADLLLHFAGDDGADTRDDHEIGMPAMLLDHAFVDAETRDLVWTIEVPEAFEVKALRTVSAQHASEVPALVIAAE